MSSPGLGFLEDSGLDAAFGVPGICVKSAVYFSYCNKRSSTPHLGVINNSNILSLLLQLLFNSGGKKKERRKMDTDNLWIQDAVRVLAVATVIA